MDFSFYPDNAYDWDRRGMTPKANSNKPEGLKYYQIHEFYFLENQGGYSEVGEYSGYTQVPRGVEDWHAIIHAWEHWRAPYCRPWKGRADMRVCLPRGSRDVEALFPRYLPGLTTYLNWDSHRERLERYYNYINTSKPEERPAPDDTTGMYTYLHREIWARAQAGDPRYPYGQPGVNLDQLMDRWLEEKHRAQLASMPVPVQGETADLEALARPGARFQSVALDQGITATITHFLDGKVYERPVEDAQLAVWVMTEMRRGQLFWQWQGAVNSWMDLAMHPISDCSQATQEHIASLVRPLVREWTQHLRECTETSSPSAKQPGEARSFPFRNDTEV